MKLEMKIIWGNRFLFCFTDPRLAVAVVVAVADVVHALVLIPHIQAHHPAAHREVRLGKLKIIRI